MPAPPVLLHAADFGWIHRPRYYYGLDVEELARLRRPGLEFFAQDVVAKDLAVVRWNGSPRPEQ